MILDSESDRTGNVTEDCESGGSLFYTQRKVQPQSKGLGDKNSSYKPNAYRNDEGSSSSGFIDDDGSSGLFPNMRANNMSFRKKDYTVDVNGSFDATYSEDDLINSDGDRSLNNDTGSRYFNRNSLESSDSYQYSESIHTSIVKQILTAPEYRQGSDKSKFFLNDMYDLVSGTPKETTLKDLDDFETYNKQVWKEDKIKSKLDAIYQHKGNNGLSALTPIRENDLKSRYEVAGDKSTSKGVPRWFTFGQTPNSPMKTIGVNKAYSTKANTNKSVHLQHPNDFLYANSSNSLVDRSNCTIPIDDDIDDYNLPIELQDYKVSKKRGSTDYFHIQKQSSESYVDPSTFETNEDIIFSTNENVDFSLNRVRSSYHDKSSSEGNRTEKKSFFSFFSIDKKRYEYKIQRKLKIRHLNQIALGGTLGVGLLLSSGKAFSIAGPLGCLLGFIISGSIVLATMLSFCEMVTLIPLAGGVSGISSRFVEDAFGFALGIGYWLSYTIGLPTEITAASIMLSFYPQLKIPGANTAGFITLFLVICLTENLLDIRVYGEIEYFSTIIKLMMLLGLMIYMAIMNSGVSPPLHEKIGFRFWDSTKSDLAHSITYGAFRPTFDVNDVGTGALNGIGGSAGRFCAIFVAASVAAYAFVGTEIVLIAGGESRNPRAAIPSATKNIYWRILIFYILAVFVVGLNIYSGDPRLLRYFTPDSGAVHSETDSAITEKVIEIQGGKYCDANLLQWAGFANGNQSPWIIALQSAGLCNFASVANAFLVYFALTAGSSQLYAASRTLYYMSIQGKAPKLFSLCSRNGVPYASVLFTSLFGALAYLSVDNNTALIFERLLSVCASTGLLVWAGMCLSFIRFYYGLKLRPDIINRDDDNYPYRSPFQPYLAYYGMTLSMLIVIVVGFIVYFDTSWSTAYFFSSYGSLIVIVLCYVAYKIGRRTKVHRLDQVDLDSGRREIDRIIWEEEKNYSSNYWELLQKISRLIY